MSNIPSAREDLSSALHKFSVNDFSEAERLVRQALSQMARVTVRRTPRQQSYIHITPNQKADILRLANSTDMTQTEIAVAVGLQAKDLGRVSEVIAGKR